MGVWVGSQILALVPRGFCCSRGKHGPEMEISGVVCVLIGNQEGPGTVGQEKRTLRDMNEGEKDDGEVGQRPRRLWDHGWLATRICAQWLPS